MTDIDISREHVEGLLKDVTPGPWRARMGSNTNPTIMYDGGQYVILSDDVDTYPGLSQAERDEWHADARFIAEARELVPAMLDEIDRMESLLRSVPGYTTGGSFRAAIADLVDSESYWKARAKQAEAKINKVRALADNAPEVPVHAGGGNLVSRQKMVAAGDILAALGGDA